MAGNRPQSPKKNSQLTLRETDFIDHLLSDDPYYRNNITRSARRAYNCSSNDSAQSTGSKVLRRPRVQAQLEKLARAKGVGLEVRLTRLAEIIHGTRTATSTSTHYIRETDEHGKLTGRFVPQSRTVHESTPTHDQTIKAVELINKTTGHYHAVRTNVAQARREIDAIMDDLVPGSVQEELSRVAVRGGKRGERTDLQRRDNAGVDGSGEHARGHGVESGQVREDKQHGAH